MLLKIFEDICNSHTNTAAQSCASLIPYLSKIFRIMKNKPRRAPGKLGNIHIILTSDKIIRQLNKKYRGKNSPTDVLTFNNEYYPQDKSNLFSEIYISLETAVQQAITHNISIADEILILAIHGLVHSAGFDHEISIEQKKKFKTQEDKILCLLKRDDLKGLTSH